MPISRRSAAFLAALPAALLLAECHAKPADPFTGEAADTSGRIACKPAAAADFQPVCSIERSSGAQGLVLTVRQPSGAFRRLLVTKDGRGVIAADGAETAQVSVAGADAIEVAIGGDRYRLPATVKGGAKPHP